VDDDRSSEGRVTSGERQSVVIVGRTIRTVPLQAGKHQQQQQQQGTCVVQVDLLRHAAGRSVYQNSRVRSSC